jgi:putative DNA methylase
MKKIHIPNVLQASATQLPYPDNYFDAVFTDPPYYDNINYAELSDFFYVWLKRILGDLYPELFSTPLVPKTKEIVANPLRQGNKDKAKNFFESNLKKSFQEIYRVLKPDGIVIIVYTHKSTSGWETVLNALLDSNLVVTATWPIDTEMKARLNAKENASLASSIYIVCRKIKKQETGYFNEVKEEIKNIFLKNWNDYGRKVFLVQTSLLQALALQLKSLENMKKLWIMKVTLSGQINFLNLFVKLLLIMQFIRFYIMALLVNFHH